MACLSTGVSRSAALGSRPLRHPDPRRLAPTRTRCVLDAFVLNRQSRRFNVQPVVGLAFGRQQLTVDDVRAGRRFADAIARTSWPIELHDTPQGQYWEAFGDDHVHYVPMGSLTPPDADNLVAAGRCIDGDVAALSSVRVMGPCIAMGAAAAHALDLAGSGSVHQIDNDALRERLRDNLERTD